MITNRDLTLKGNQNNFNNHMPRRELKVPHQVEDWLLELSRQLTGPARMILIGSGALLWHAYQNGAENTGTSLHCVAREIPPVFSSFF